MRLSFEVSDARNEGSSVHSGMSEVSMMLILESVALDPQHCHELC